MSSILEALKKLEDEKAARRSGAGSLAGKVAKSGRKSRTSPAWLIPGGMLAVAAVSVLITYAVMRPVPSTVTGPAPQPTQNAPVRSPAAQPPDTPLPAVATPVTDALSPHHPGPIPGEKKSSRSTMARRSVTPSKITTGKASPLSADSGKNRPTSAVPPLPKLTVVGIAWQKDTALRMAIVNGVPVREGGVVNGATVREILPDRVRFSANGKEFDISLEN
jgi:general secretion pathway protein B